jgi:hypothetical protein
MKKTKKKPTNVAISGSEASAPDNSAPADITQNPEVAEITRYDWDFKALSGPDVSTEQLIACCCYEYARESKTILAHYNEGKPVESFTGGLNYNAEVDGVVRTLPNPFVWLWSPTWGRLFSKPWHDMEEKWRASVIEQYKDGFRHYLPKAFISADSQFMKRGIISRGDGRMGIDREKGRERIAVEIDWSSYTTKEIVESFAEWIEGKRPPGIGRDSDQGRGKDSSWYKMLENLAIMRLLKRATLREMPTEYPQAWRRYGSKPPAKGANDTVESQERELYKRRKKAENDFRRLFPFLPVDERPFSCRD